MKQQPQHSQWKNWNNTLIYWRIEVILEKNKDFCFVEKTKHKLEKREKRTFIGLIARSLEMEENMLKN